MNVFDIRGTHLPKRTFEIMLLVVFILIIIVAYIWGTGSYTYTKTGYALNTIIKITLEAKDQKTAETIAEKAFDEIQRVEKLLSCHIPESEISKINTMAHKEPQSISAETYNLISRCTEYAEQTKGAFDITVKPLADLWNINSDNPKVPTQSQIEEALQGVGINNVILMGENRVYLSNPYTRIDLGGVAKGYCADRVKLVLEQNSIVNALVDLGGNIYAMGDRQWNIGIQKPFAERGESFYVLNLTNSSAVTSGAYERYFKENGKIYHHIINPHNGYPADSGLESVTIVSTSSELADVLSTAAFILGEEHTTELLGEFDNCYAVMLKNDGTVLNTSQSMQISTK